MPFINWQTVYKITKINLRSFSVLSISVTYTYLKNSVIFVCRMDNCNYFIRGFFSLNSMMARFSSYVLVRIVLLLEVDAIAWQRKFTHRCDIDYDYEPISTGPWPWAPVLWKASANHETARHSMESSRKIHKNHSGRNFPGKFHRLPLKIGNGESDPTYTRLKTRKRVDCAGKFIRLIRESDLRESDLSDVYCIWKSEYSRVALQRTPVTTYPPLT